MGTFDNTSEGTTQKICAADREDLVTMDSFIICVGRCRAGCENVKFAALCFAEKKRRNRLLGVSLQLVEIGSNFLRGIGTTKSAMDQLHWGSFAPGYSSGLVLPFSTLVHEVKNTKYQMLQKPSFITWCFRKTMHLPKPRSRDPLFNTTASSMS